MKVFKEEHRILAKLISPEDWNHGLSFFSDDNEFIQVGTWYYDAGKQLSDHIHNEFERNTTRTCEAIYMVSGSMRVRLYTLNRKLVEIFDIKQGDILILLDSGHGYEILEDGTKVIEIKNGPFMGADIDKIKF